MYFFFQIMDFVAAAAYAVECAIIKWHAALTQEESEQQMPNAQNVKNVRNVQSPLILQSTSNVHFPETTTCVHLSQKALNIQINKA